jgi:hypothetical protein
MSEKPKTVSIEVPMAWAESIKKFLKSVDGAKPDTRGGRAIDYGAYERAVEKSAGELEKEAHRGLLQELDIDAAQVTINGKLHTRVGRYEAPYKTKTGEVRVTRSLYRENGVRNAKTVDPVSLRVGALEEGWLPDTAKAMAFLVQQNPSREAAKAAQQVGRLPYSRSSFERVAHAVGTLYDAVHAEVEDALIEAYQVPEEARSVSAGLDRVSVPMEEPKGRPVGRPAKDAPKNPVERNFRMAYVGTVTLNDAEGEALHTIRYGRMPNGDATALCEGMMADVASLLHQRPDLKVQTLVDGAAEMHNLLAAAVNQATLGKPVYELVDFGHLLQKLTPAAAVIFGEAQSQVRARWKLSLLNTHGAVWKILSELRESAQESVVVDGKQPVHEAITYLQNNGERMNYAEARQQGLPIGSGATEATCKNLFEVRLKRCGARWHDVTGAHVVQLRALALSDRWDNGIALTFKELRAPVRLAS